MYKWLYVCMSRSKLSPSKKHKHSTVARTRREQVSVWEWVPTKFFFFIFKKKNTLRAKHLWDLGWLQNSCFSFKLCDHHHLPTPFLSSSFIIQGRVFFFFNSPMIPITLVDPNILFYGCSFWIIVAQILLLGCG